MLKNKDEPLSHPLYLAVTANNNQESRVHDFIQSKMKKIIEKHPGLDLEDAMKDFKSPPNFHVTVLYIGDDLTRMETDIYKKFEEN